MCARDDRAHLGDFDPLVCGVSRHDISSFVIKMSMVTFSAVFAVKTRWVVSRR